MAYGRDHRAGLFSRIDERHHQPVDTSIEIARQKRALMRIRTEDRPAAAGARRPRHFARLIEACRAVLAIDEDRIRLQLSEARRQSRGNMVGVYHENMLTRREALAQFRSDHRFSPVLSWLLLVPFVST